MSSLLGRSEPSPVTIETPTGSSPLLLVSDHAGNRMPEKLGTLGLSERDRNRHIAWDIGIRSVTSLVSERIDATYIYQGYSRLVIDCNRMPGCAESMPVVSDGTAIPGNREVAASETAQRVEAIFRPYHAAIVEHLEGRDRVGRLTALISMHSFTPKLNTAKVARPWQIGIIYHNDNRIGRALVGLLRANSALCVGENEPYNVDIDVDYTIPVYGERRGVPYVEIEIRQDLIGQEAGQREWATRMAEVLPRAVELSGVLRR
jgi:predicted N-formylglutamate amidohydrolase